MANEAELLIRIREGDEAAKEELFQRKEKKFSRLLKSRLSGPVELQWHDDIMQKFWIAFNRSLDRFDHGRLVDGAIDAWMYGILNKLVLAHRRDAQRGGYKVSLDDIPTPAANTHSPNDASEELRVLFDKAKISIDDQQILDLKIVRGFTAPQMAETSDLTPSQIYRRCAEALAKLGREEERLA